MILLFQTLYDARHKLSLLFGSSLNDLGLQSRSEGYETAGTCVIILFVKLHGATKNFHDG